MSVTVLFKPRKKSEWIFLCDACQSLLKAHEEDLRTKIVTLSYDGSDRYERKYVICCLWYGDGVLPVRQGDLLIGLSRSSGRSGQTEILADDDGSMYWRPISQNGVSG